MRVSFFLAFILSGCMLPQWACGQFADSFDLPELAPHWQGDTERFRVWQNALQLYDSLPASSNISRLWAPVSTSTPDTCLWEARMELQFAPSGSNYAVLWLAASAVDFGNSPSGYFLRVGGISGDLDALQLWRSDAGTNTLLLEGQPGAVGLAPAIARVRVLRTNGNAWELWADYEGGHNYQLEGTAMDNTHAEGKFLIWECRYTSTRSQHFFLSDLRVEPLHQDTVPPTLLQVELVSATELLLQFSEALDSAWASEPDRYTLSGGIGHPAEVLVGEGADSTRVWLFLEHPLQHLQAYTLYLDTLFDPRGNFSLPQTREFTFYDIRPVSPYEVLITEMMADPSPPLGLPDAEYIELHYTGVYAADLSGWTIKIGSQQRSLPPYLMLPGAYLILCRAGDGHAFQNAGEVLEIPSLPALANAGASISLYNAEEVLIHHVRYSDTWYRHPEKRKGGWSLEMIDLQQACLGRENWRASVHPLGGTPGQPNSLPASSFVFHEPKLLHVYPLELDSLLLMFSGVIERAPNPDIFRIHGGPNAVRAELLLPDANELLLVLDDEIPMDELLELEVLPGLRDCLGRSVPGGKALFGWPVPALPGQVQLNELMYHPLSGTPAYLEITNRGELPADLSEILLGDGALGVAVTARRLLLPGEYLVFCPDPDALMEQFPAAVPEQVLTQALPAWRAPEGLVWLYTSQGLIDSLHYSDGQHNSLLASTRGVALERLEGSNSWHSAATAVAPGTPTKPNSQRLRQSANASSDWFYLVPETFSPDGDGFDDLLYIHYEFDDPEYWARVEVYNAQGRLVEQITDGQPLGKQGYLLWDGAGSRQTLLPIGVYLVRIQWWHPSGRSGQERRPFVLARRP